MLLLCVALRVQKAEAVKSKQMQRWPLRWSHLRGEQNLYNSLRQFGGVVHRRLNSGGSGFTYSSASIEVYHMKSAHKH